MSPHDESIEADEPIGTSNPIAMPPIASCRATGMAAPTPAERAGLARRYQAAAFRASDPLLANIGVMNGDLMLLAHTLGVNAVALVEDSADRASSSPVLEMLLKLHRQIERSATSSAK